MDEKKDQACMVMASVPIHPSRAGFDHTRWQMRCLVLPEQGQTQPNLPGDQPLRPDTTRPFSDR